MPILVCPLSHVETVVKHRSPARIVSLLDPESAFPSLPGLAQGQHLKLPVDDISEDMAGRKAPCEKVVAAILHFVSDWDRRAPMLIHCWAGISRSTATAFVTACVHNPHVDEREIAQALRAASPTATPNRRIVALADASLGRAGRMSAAIDAIGRGSPGWPDISEAKPFELPSAFGTLSAAT